MRRPAIGAMRLSTEPDRDDARAIEVLHAAFGLRVAVVDTADAYCWNDSEIGHNERLIARALSTWRGDRSGLVIATKGGMTRPEGRWEPDGRARHLAAACERSCEALGVRQIDLYQLHLPDPRVPLATSVRALAALQRNGMVRAIGLSNVTVGQIEEARRIVEVSSVQVELNLWNESSVLGGVVDYCRRHRLPFLASRPLGGRRAASRLTNDPVLIDVAERHDATPAEIALAWLADLSDLIVPIPGVTRVESVHSVARASAIQFSESDRDLLDRRFPAGRMLRTERVSTTSRAGEVVLIMGLPGAGKTKVANRFAGDGYTRLNRDDAGGTLRDLLPALGRALASESPRVVLDNTYVTRKSRAEVVRAARESGVDVRCIWVTTSVEDAQVNAVTRIIRKYGRLPGEAELTRLRKQDVAAFLPAAQFRLHREFEPPDASEGFSLIEAVAFTRERDPGYVNRAIVLWLDRPSLDEASAAALLERQQQGWKVIGLSWQPGIEAGTTSREEVDAQFAAMRGRTGVQIEIEYCPHAAGPPRCWCRKPLPGLGVLVIERHQLDPSQCIYVGSGPQDPAFARKLGFTLVTAIA